MNSYLLTLAAEGSTPSANGSISVLSAIGISVIASVLAVVLMWILRLSVEHAINRFGHKVAWVHITDISGSWKGANRDRSGNEMKDSVEIWQLGAKVGGTISYTVQLAGNKSRDKEFEFVGLLRNDLLSIHYWNADRREIGSGAMCLLVSNDGDRMVGKYAWWDVELDKIDATPENVDFVWERVAV